MEDAAPNTNAAPEHLIVGQVVAPFGIKGEVKVNILTEFPDRFKKLQEVLLAPFTSIEPGLAPTAALDPATVRATSDTSRRSDGAQVSGLKPPGGPTPFAIQSTHIHKGQLLLKLEGVDTVNDADVLRGYWVLVPRESAHRLPRGAYFIYQIVGLDVYTQAGELVGKVTDVLTTSGNDVYVVKGPGVRDPSGELLVPAVKQIVKRLDPNKGRMVIADPAEWA
ncbi:MAG: ribosome maturation factor RimM [Chloroflexia bacterium]